jgi:Domain of unknown function (DUF4491)
MTLQWAGLVLAALIFGTIGLGHVAVRKLNYRYGTKPAPFFLVLGLSLLVTSNLASAALGIVRMTTLWDAVEFVRQEERIRRGHAPANPDRPVKLRPR